jgi:hypothetical protein
VVELEAITDPPTVKLTVANCTVLLSVPEARDLRGALERSINAVLGYKLYWREDL